MTIQIVIGDLLDATEQYIAHQCNCITKRAAHLSKSVFEAFPWANTYTQRNKPSKLGSIDINGNGYDQRFVINMYAQYYPGRPKYPNSRSDGTAARENAFRTCLISIAKIPDLISIAFPEGIGCGAAGGNWQRYLTMIEKFADETNLDVTLYRLPTAATNVDSLFA